MKKILSILLALALMLGATFALAEGNVTIAVQGMNDFNDYIQSMVVYGDRLLLSSWDRLYTWDNATRKLTEVDGYGELESTLTGDGETPGVLDLNDGDYAYLDGNLYIVGGRLYRMATVTDSDGNASNQLVELLIADDGALCTYNDVSYFFKKLVKYTNNAWEYSTDNVLKMIVSYDDFGETVGFDAEMPQFTEVVPYEGAFTYSVKHDENEQPIVTSHGELQLLNDQRLVGDVKAKNGLDVNGVKDSSLNGYLDLKDTKADTAMGLGVNSVSHFVVEPDDDGADVEHFTGSVALSYRDNGEDEYSLIAAVEGNTKTDGDAFATLADVSLTLTDIFKLGANVTLEQADYEEIEFAGGQAIDMTQLTDAQLDQIQNEVTQQAAKLSASLVMHPGVLANLLTLVGD